MRYMFAKHPEIAARWEDKYGISKKLPQHVNGKKSKSRKKVRRAPKKR